VSTLDGQNIFNSGPHTIRLGSWQRQLDRRGFAGLDGELIVDMGLRSRQIIQEGRLQAVSAAALHTLISQIEARADAQAHTLVDNHGQVFDRVLIEHFELTSPARRGRGFWSDYTLRYRQLA